MIPLGGSFGWQAYVNPPSPDALDISGFELVLARHDNSFLAVTVLNGEAIILNLALWIVVGFIEDSIIGDDRACPVECDQKRRLASLILPDKARLPVADLDGAGVPNALEFSYAILL